MMFETARETIIKAIATRVDGAGEVAALLVRPEADAAFFDLGIDSLSTLDLCLALEDELGFEVEPRHLALHPSINALARFAAESTGGPTSKTT